MKRGRKEKTINPIAFPVDAGTWLRNRETGRHRTWFTDRPSWLQAKGQGEEWAGKHTSSYMPCATPYRSAAREEKWGAPPALGERWAQQLFRPCLKGLLGVLQRDKRTKGVPKREVHGQRNDLPGKWQESWKRREERDLRCTFIQALNFIDEKTKMRMRPRHVRWHIVTQLKIKANLEPASLWCMSNMVLSLPLTDVQWQREDR